MVAITVAPPSVTLPALVTPPAVATLPGQVATAGVSDGCGSIGGAVFMAPVGQHRQKGTNDENDGTGMPPRGDPSD